MQTLIHWHEEIEFLKILKGKGALFFDGKFFEINSSELIVLTPFSMHALSAEVEVESRLFSLKAFPSLMCFLPLLNAKQTAPLKLPADNQAETLFSSNLSDVDVEEILRDVLLTLQKSKLLKVAKQPVFERQLYTTKRVLEFLEANFSREIRISDLAEMVAFSEFYLMKVFKKITGFSIVDYLNTLRLTVASKLLAETDDDISSIAREVGFFNISYFNRQFKKLFHVTPTEAKKRES